MTICTKCGTDTQSLAYHRCQMSEVLVRAIAREEANIALANWDPKNWDPVDGTTPIERVLSEHAAMREIAREEIRAHHKSVAPADYYERYRHEMEAGMANRQALKSQPAVEAVFPGRCYEPAHSRLEEERDALRCEAANAKKECAQWADQHEISRKVWQASVEQHIADRDTLRTKLSAAEGALDEIWMHVRPACDPGVAHREAIVDIIKRLGGDGRAAS